MIRELVRRADCLRILKVLERRPLRFTEIQKSLRLNPAQVARALTFLRNRLFVIAKTLPAERGPLRLEYGLSKRGISLAKDLCHKPEFGKSEGDELLSHSR